MEQFQADTGISPVFGGYHLSKGTKNALVNLGNQCYLEFLAIDETNTAIAPPRWMGVDLIADTAQITRWSLKSSQLKMDSQLLKQVHPSLGTIQGGQRKMTNGKLLTWEMILPISSPVVDILPFMTDWQHSEAHPTDQLPIFCQLLALQFFHPIPKSVQKTFKALDLGYTIQKGPSPAIQLRLETPKGIRVF